jgi:purine-binding chemotaxis protein CheW
MNRQLCTFKVGEHRFGVDVLSVQEILRPQEMTPVPRAPEVVRGLINLRGQILTALDLRRRLHLPPAPEDCPQMNIIVQAPDGAVSLIVDDVGDVLTVLEENVEPSPATLGATLQEIITGVYKLKESLLLILSVTAATEISGLALSERN